MIKNKNKKIISKKDGFTIIESLVAIFILVISLTGPMVFSQSGLRAAFVSRDQITAFFLAQDTFEYIKNIRDDNVLEYLADNTSGVEWLDNFDDCLDARGCTIDTSTNNLASAFNICTSSSVEGCMDDPETPDKNYTTLKRDSDGVFGFNGSEDSIFARHIFIEETVPGREAEVTVYVRWNTAETIGLRQIVVKETIFDSWETEPDS
jgi:prepilin-type N-terminal cleavage/methylation domain-containing protein